MPYHYKFKNYVDAVQWFAESLELKPDSAKKLTEVMPASNALAAISLDIDREFLFSKNQEQLSAEANNFFDGWFKLRDFCYSQVDMTGGGIFRYIWDDFVLKVDADLLNNQLLTQVRFGYLDDQGVRSGLMIQLDPRPGHGDRWMLSLVKNTNDPDLAKRNATFFCSDAKGLDFLARKEKAVKLGRNTIDEIVNAVDSKALGQEMRKIFSGVNINSAALKQFQDTCTVHSSRVHYLDFWLVKLIGAELKSSNQNNARKEAIVSYLVDHKQDGSIDKAVIAQKVDTYISERPELVKGNLDVLIKGMTSLKNELLETGATEEKHASSQDAVNKAVVMFCEQSLTRLEQLRVKVGREALIASRLAEEAKKEAASVKEIQSTWSKMSLLIGGLFGSGLGAVCYFAAIAAGILAPATLGVSLLIPLAIVVGGAILGAAAGNKISKIDAYGVEPPTVISNVGLPDKKDHKKKTGESTSKIAKGAHMDVTPSSSPSASTSHLSDRSASTSISETKPAESDASAQGGLKRKL